MVSRYVPALCMATAHTEGERQRPHCSLQARQSGGRRKPVLNIGLRPQFESHLASQPVRSLSALISLITISSLPSPDPPEEQPSSRSCLPHSTVDPPQPARDRRQPSQAAAEEQRGRAESRKWEGLTNCASEKEKTARKARTAEQKKSSRQAQSTDRPLSD